MIIFTDRKDLLPYIDNVVLCNFTSYSVPQGAIDLSSLATCANNIALQAGELANAYINTPEFDLNYLNYVINTDLLFGALMIIMENTFNDNNVVLLVHRDDYRDQLMEALQCLIKNRYGCASWIINTLEDLECVEPSNFTPMGIVTLDQDRERFNNYKMSKGMI